MNDINAAIAYLKEFNTISIVVRLILSIILGGFIGIERSKSGRAAGLRTHILVCLGSTIASMTGLYINQMVGGDASRIAAQVISGIGVVSAGSIMIRHKSTIVGLTTAACVWAVGTVGIAIGYGFYEAAIIGVLLIMFITTTLNALDSRLRHDMKEVSVYVEFVDSKNINTTLSMIKEIGVEIETISVEKTKTSSHNGIGADLLIHINKKKNIDAFIEQLNQIENIEFAIRTTY